MRKNCIAEVAKALGLELEEVFCIDGDEHYFRLTDTGLETKRNFESKDWYLEITATLNSLLIGENEVIKLPWKPDNGEIYYVPDVTTDKKYSIWKWFNFECDQLHYQRGVVFKTAEEAITVADEIISNCKERWNVQKMKYSGKSV
jgi:hypothetical protein